MSRDAAEIVVVELTFHADSTQQERDTDFAYLYEKLSELIQETSAFSSYYVRTDETHPNPD